MRHAQCTSAWAVVQQETAGAKMPTNSGMARSMYCCRTATRPVSSGRHLLQRPGEVAPPGVRQHETVPKDRIVGQDRGVDADRQLRPVGDGVVDGVVDRQESGPVAVEVAEGVPGPSICTSMLPWDGALPAAGTG